MNPYFLYLIISVIGLVAWFLLLRAAVRADSLNDNLKELVNQQRATNWFLIKLLEKNGVDSEHIEKIKSAFNIK